jgi:hypothetical protein
LGRKRRKKNIIFEYLNKKQVILINLSMSGNGIKSILNTYRMNYKHYDDIETCITDALKVYKTNDQKQIWELWRNHGLKTVARDIAVDLHNFKEGNLVLN